MPAVRLFPERGPLGRGVPRVAAAPKLRQARLHALMRLAADSMFRASGAGTVQAVEGWSALTGRAEREALGAGWLRRVHPDDLPGVRALWRASRPTGRAFEAYCRVLDARQRWRWVRLSATALFDARGRCVEWVGLLRDVHDSHLEFRRMYHIAYHDMLTGLPNRACLLSRLRELVAGEAGWRHALLYMDLDRFKEVNDTLGHAVGDALLGVVAGRLRAAVRTGDLVARLGGDEFVALVRLGGGAPDPGALARRFIDTLRKPFLVHGHHLSVGLTIGMTFLRGGGQDSAEAALRRADIALYRAKTVGRGGHACFESRGGEA